MSIHFEINQKMWYVYRKGRIVYCSTSLRKVLDYIS